MTDLDKLIEAVEGGVAEPSHFNAVFNKNSAHWVNGQNAELADDGSLDAAKALHEALLPGWEVRIATYPEECDAMVHVPDGIGKFWAFNKCPARAWLIAILKAYRRLQ